MSFDLVLFGGTVDLAWRKLMPALFQASRHGTLPPAGRILAVGREEYGTTEYAVTFNASEPQGTRSSTHAAPDHDHFVFANGTVS